MTVFTTNWYLHRTYLHPISAKPQKDNPPRATNTNKTKNRTSQKNNTAKKTAEFEEILKEAVDEGLSLLGESAKQVVYFHLEKTFKISKLDIPYKIEEFSNALDKIFGNGAKILEIGIMKSLFKKIGYKIKNYPEQKNLDFTEYVEAIKQAKKKYENNN